MFIYLRHTLRRNFIKDIAMLFFLCIALSFCLRDWNFTILCPFGTLSARASPECYQFTVFAVITAPESVTPSESCAFSCKHHLAHKKLYYLLLYLSTKNIKLVLTKYRPPGQEFFPDNPDLHLKDNLFPANLACA